VGINTYGILDSQGINGAIEIGELITLLTDNNISYKATMKGIPVPIILLITVLLVMVHFLFSLYEKGNASIILGIRCRKKRTER
jgi:hypothetical protein